MRNLALTVLLAALSGPAAAQYLPEAVVWNPPDGFTAWSEVDGLMRARDGMKLTIGLAPAMATPLVKAALTPWIETGRVEIASRIDGDPVLPLIAGLPAAPRPQDAPERALEAREQLRKKLGQAPTGFAPGAGAVDAAVCASLAESGAAWVLTGPYASAEGPWAAAAPGPVFVPSSAVRLYDESALASSVFLTVAAELPRPPAGWATVGELARLKLQAPVDPASVPSWPAWNTEAARYADEDEGVKASWDAYAAAAQTLERYQNSGAAKLRTLDAAVALLRKAQAARFYRPAEEPGPSPELRAALIAVYKKLKLPAPDSLYGGSSPGAAGSGSDHPTGVRALSGPSWVEFRAPLGSIALAPSLQAGATAQIADGGAAADPWRIRSLRVEWDDAAVRVRVRVGLVSVASPRPVYDVYVDFNHVLGAGRVPMLEGRGAVVLARDAWELALSIVGGEARLFRARAGAQPKESAAFKTVWSPEQNEAVVTVPRSYMRGNPSRWGWAAVALAEDPDRPGQRPAASWVAPDGTILLGVLAPTEAQKPILSRSNARVPAARLDR